ncbi:MAG: glycosyltransferase [Herpetosiphonaceae bacterium]|nr:glycosyltransferase [Herpetosiphonaceae bacterium]
MLSVHSSPLATLGGKEAGGMNVYVRELARELGRQGVAVDIFTRCQDRESPVVVNIAPNVRVLTVRVGPAAPYDKNWVLDYLPEFVHRIRCVADGEDIHYDIIHSHYWLSGLAALELRQAWGTPVIHMFHTLAAMKNTIARGDEAETADRLAGERMLLQEVDRVVAATPLDRAQMIQHYAAEIERIVVIPCGVDLNHFHPIEQDRAREELGVPPHPHKMLLFVGRIEPLKGIDTLLRAMALLVEQRPAWWGDICLAIIGGDRRETPDQWSAEMKRLRRLQGELGIGELVTFQGSQDQRKLPVFYSASDAVIVPSHYESFGMVALEAMACGTPVIASNVGGLRYTIRDGETGLLVPREDPQALAEKIALLLDDEALRLKLGQQSTQTAQRYSWSTIAHEIRELYTEVICGEPCRQPALVG